MSNETARQLPRFWVPPRGNSPARRVHRRDSNPAGNQIQRTALLVISSKAAWMADLLVCQPGRAMAFHHVRPIGVANCSQLESGRAAGECHFPVTSSCFGGMVETIHQFMQWFTPLRQA